MEMRSRESGGITSVSAVALLVSGIVSTLSGDGDGVGRGLRSVLILAFVLDVFGVDPFGFKGFVSFLVAVARECGDGMGTLWPMILGCSFMLV